MWPCSFASVRRRRQEPSGREPTHPPRSPLSINRLEQRIGRADRFNETSLTGGVPSVVFAEPRSAMDIGPPSPAHSGSPSIRTVRRDAAAPLADYEHELKERLFSDRGWQHSKWTSRHYENDSTMSEPDRPARGTRGDADPQGVHPAEIEDLVDFEEAWLHDGGSLRSPDIEERRHSAPEVGRGEAAGAFSYSIDPTLQTIPLMPGHQQERLMPLLPGIRTFNRSVALRHPEARLVRLRRSTRRLDRELPAHR